MDAKFGPGRVVATPGVLDALAAVEVLPSGKLMSWCL